MIQKSGVKFKISMTILFYRDIDSLLMDSELGPAELHEISPI